MHYILPFLFLATSIGLVKGNEAEESCRYWCRTSDRRYYCCSTTKSGNWVEHTWHSFLFPWFWISIGESHVVPLPHSPWQEMSVTDGKNKKHCPPLRARCPRTYDWHSAPTFCEDDENCGEREKCCYDVCLEHKTCKQAE